MTGMLIDFGVTFWTDTSNVRQLSGVSPNTVRKDVNDKHDFWMCKCFLEDLSTRIFMSCHIASTFHTHGHL